MFCRLKTTYRPFLPAIFMVACIVFYGGRAANTEETAGLDNNSTVDMLESTKDIADRQKKPFRLFVAMPDETPPEGGWPLILLLDGNVTFEMAKALHPQALLLGIGYPTKERSEIVARRFYDLTGFAPPERIPLREGTKPPKTGGEADFRRFLVDDVLPEIARNFPVNDKKITLYGHSLGGLFVMNTLLSQDHAKFHTYCAADPSIWWNGHEFMATLQNYQKPDIFNPQLLIEIAALKTHHSDVTKREKRVADLRSGANGQNVAQVLADKKGIANVFFRFDNKNHGTMIAPSIKHCLAFSLDGKKPDATQ